ncbi:GNAT family N-acetyltransferase [Leucobacter sp. UCMA 4100]|uniref:GNAT family N-acetyltransferase n=1 Tax=Leucobacter sp. UCMA 4100 TaxID=2810534 RepID=UPI003FA54BB3
MGSVNIHDGFTEAERGSVSTLYWEAFGRKLRPAFVDEATGLETLRTALRATRTLVAREKGHVLGICGFHQGRTGVADLGWASLRQSLSIVAALRASFVLSLLAHREDPDALVLDGICVDQAARGRGIGSSLLEAAANKARQTGAKTVKLSVIDKNSRARALYERHGFKPTGHETLGPLASLYGFNGYTRMELNVRS